MRAGSHVLVALVMTACTERDPSTPAPAATPTPTSTPAPAPTPAPKEVPPCRVIAETGAARIEVGSAVTDWLDLAAGARLTVKEPRTGRELIFLGPARARPCADDAQTWLARGRFESTRGMGESPGAEEWIVTPSAVVRYGAALITVDAGPKGVRAVASGGSASAATLDVDGWTAIDPASPFETHAPPADAGSAAKRCDEARAAEESLSRAVTEKGPDAAPFGEAAVRAAGAHNRMRVACAIAALLASERR